MGVSQKAFNENQRKRLFRSYPKKETLPDNVTRDIIVCSNCGFKARYKFLRCPHCNELQK